MADEVTKIADVIVPELFNDYVINLTTEKSALVQGGIIATNPELDKLAQGAGSLITMPQWDDLSGESDTLEDTKDIELNKITVSKDVARKQFRTKAWSATDLSGALAGSDPMGAVASRVADFRARDYQKILLATLDGIFSSTSMKGVNQFDISTDGSNPYFSADSFLNAQYMLGDHYDSLTAIAVHSMTKKQMEVNDMIDYIPDSKGGVMPTYRGFTIIVDDSLPVTKDGIYTTYLFGQGAVGFADGTNGSIAHPTEIVREARKNGGQDELINRWAFVMHLRGVKWTELSVTGQTPINKELANGKNFERVYDPKKIRVVKFMHKVAGGKLPDAPLSDGGTIDGNKTPDDSQADETEKAKATK